MTKDTFDVAEDIKSLIDIPEIRAKLTGNIYKIYRPTGSKNSDIVIGIISCDNFWMQTALVNVRIYVPSIVSDGNKVPDLAKFKEIGGEILHHLDGQYRTSFWTEAEEERGLIRQPDGTFFQLIKVTYRAIQDNYTNI